MPLNKKGKKILKSMKEQYGSDAEKVFYASKNKGVIKNVEKKMSGGLSGGKRSGPPPSKGPDAQGFKVAKAFMGLGVEVAKKNPYSLLGVGGSFLKRSEGARDLLSKAGVGSKLIADEFEREAEKEEQKKSMGLKQGGMSCPYRRGGKTGIQGVSKIQVKGQKFTGTK